MPTKRLRVSGAPNWAFTGVYEALPDECPTFAHQRSSYTIVKRDGLWVLLHHGTVLARQKDSTGPSTKAGQKAWKLAAQDHTFHSPPVPMEVEECEAPEQQESGAETQEVRCVGFGISPKDMRPGDAVLRHVRITTGPACGWEMECRLDMDRHFDKESSRAPRWMFISPSGDRMATFKSHNAQAWCVQNHRSVSAEAYTQLGRIKESLRMQLQARRDEMKEAGTLIDCEAEALWQRLLEARNDGVQGEALRALHQQWAAIAVPTEASVPEWRPPDIGQMPKVFHTKRSATASAMTASSPSGTAGTPRTMGATHPQRRPRDEFLKLVLRQLREKPQADEPEESASEQSEVGATTMTHRKRQRRHSAGARSEATGKPPAAEEERGEEGEAAEASPAEEEAAAQQQQQQAASRDLAEASSAVPLESLLERSKAEAEVAASTAGASAWQEVLAGALTVGGDGEGLSPKRCDAAWRHAVALAVLGETDSQFAFGLIDLLRESARRGQATGALLARLLAVKEALLRGGNDGQTLCRAVWSLLIKQGLQSANAAAEKLGDLALHLCKRHEAPAMLLLPGDLPPLCAFAMLIKDCGVVETVPKLLAAEERWPEWQRGLAVLFGAALAGSTSAGEVLLALLGAQATWPEDAPASGRWQLWLLLSSCEATGQAALALQPPDPDLEVWHAFVAAQRRMARSQRSALVAAVAPLVPSAQGKALLSKLMTDNSSSKNLAQLFNVWSDEAAVCRREHMKPEAPKTGDADAAKAGDSFAASGGVAFAKCGAIAAMALWRQWSKSHDFQRMLPRMQSAAECIGQVLSLLLSPHGGSGASDKCRSLVETNFGSPLSDGQWPTVLGSFDERFNSEGKGVQHFSSTGKLAHLQGQSFSGVYGSNRALVSWCVEKHFESWKPPLGAPARSAAATEAESDAKSPARGPKNQNQESEAKSEARGSNKSQNQEVNRFAQWALEVFAGDTPLLHLARPPAQVAVVGTSAEAEQELGRACHRASLACRHVFAPLIKSIIRQHHRAPSSPSVAAGGGSAANSSEHTAKLGMPGWLRAAALAAALRASLLSLADAHDGTGPETGEVSSAARECLGLLAQCQEGGGSCSAGFPANAAVEQADKLEPPTTRAWAFACLARDLHTILGWLQVLGGPGEPRAASLFRLAAVAARLLGGQWPAPPACPRRATFAKRLHFNPLRDALPPGQPEDRALTPRILRLRPLSAALAYHPTPPEASLATFAALEAAVGARRPGEVADEERGEPFGAWAEALAGSDAEDFLRLRGWRQRTLETLGSSVAARHLLAAVSSRCAAVHCAVAARHGRAAVASLLALLLLDLGECDGVAILQDHHELVKALLAGATEQQDARLWSVRHLLYRFVAVQKLARILGSAEGVVPLKAAVERLGQWVKRDGFADEETSAAMRLASDLTSSWSKLPVSLEEVRAPLIAEMVAPVPLAPDGCFSGVADVPKHDTASVLRAMWAAASSSTTG